MSLEILAFASQRCRDEREQKKWGIHLAIVLSSSITAVLNGGRLVVITLEIVDKVELVVLVMDVLVDLFDPQRESGESKRSARSRTRRHDTVRV